MKIYIASSWKNGGAVLAITDWLRSIDHEVDCFADSSTGRYVFHFSEIADPRDLNVINFLADKRTQKAFQEDKKWLDWCECCLLYLPAGRSAHLEAGYAKGQGKKLIIFQCKFPKGEFDTMYGFADLITSNLNTIREWLDGERPE